MSDRLYAARDLLRRSIAVVPPKYQDKPAPSHIFNGFVRSFLGSGKGTSWLVKLHGLESEALDRVLQNSASEFQKQALKLALDASFNADLRSYGKFASYLPVSRHFVGSDASHEHYGDIGNGWSDKERIEVAKLLEQLLESDSSQDVLSRLAKFFEESNLFSVESNSPPELNFAGADGDFRNTSSRIMANTLRQAIRTQGQYGRIASIRRVETILSFLVTLGLMWDGAKRNSDGGRSGYRSIGVVVYTDVPPGKPEERLTYLASQSLQNLLVRSHRGTNLTVRDLIGDATDLEAMSNADFEFHLAGCGVTRINDEVIEAIRRFQNPEYGFKPDEGMVSFSELRDSVATLGRKIGVVGPQRGKGEPRFILETQILEALVLCLVSRSMSVQNFVDAVYKNFGLIVGLPTLLGEDEIERLSSLCDGSVTVRSTLIDAQSALQRRLIEAGLARAYSDGTAVMEAL
jgi:hypothetical protein